MPRKQSQKKPDSSEPTALHEENADSLREAERRIEEAAKSGALSLDLRNLDLTSLPESLCRLTHLERLDISGNRLSVLPAALGQLTELREFYGFENEFRSVPASLGHLSKLDTLNLHANLLTVLPKSLGRLKKLEFLDVGRNDLEELPTWVGSLSELQYLDFSYNRVRELPDGLGQLTRLKYLVVSGNLLTLLPGALRELTELEGLDIGINKLSALPESSCWPARLRYFFAGHNKLKSLPSSLRASLSALEVLDLNGNEGLGLPPEILGPVHYARRWEFGPFSIAVTPPATSPAAIVDYYFRARRDRRPLNEAKLILVGRGGVGKTCLIKRMLHDTFDEREPETPGIEIQQWPVTLSEGDTVRLHVWDFGGQEILHATHQFFLTERTLYLLVLSGREGNLTQDAEYWLQLIRSFGGDSRVIIALNKAVQHPFDVNRGLLLEKYPVIAGFVSTDCEDASGIQELRDLILRKTETLEHRKVGFPADWFEIKERLAGMKENFVTWDQYQEICRELGEQ